MSFGNGISGWVGQWIKINEAQKVRSRARLIRALRRSVYSHCQRTSVNRVVVLMITIVAQ